jgi:glycosyltransferase involved in cell wall biosynthesis
LGMRVAVDTNALYTTRAGVARYIDGLLGGFASLKPAGCEFIPFAWKVENFRYEQPWRALKTFYRELVWGPVLGGLELKSTRADLLHSNSTIIVEPPREFPHVFTLHDLAILHTPERFRRWQRYSFKRSLQKLRHVRKILCVSRFTADEAIRFLGIDAKRLEVVLHGNHFAADKITPERPDFTIPDEFVLFVGSLEPGKNLALLREAWNTAAAAGHPLPPLLIVGARWAGVPGEGSPPPDWRYLGRQSDEVLAYLYRRAIALAFPSKFEGFGFPILEAMSLGCPVICSRVASLPEVGGDAAIYVPMDAGSYSESIRALVRDPQLREEHRAAGLKQAATFSWKKCAAETLNVYHEALGQ